MLALCVFDALADGPAAAAEIARVLAPGGRFVHFLDMATLLEQPFTKLAGSSLVPIPNVFGDPGDHEWPLDIVLLERPWLDGLLRFAAQAGHPFAATSRRCSRRSSRRRSTSRRAAAAFKAIASSGERRRTLATLLTSASRLSVAQGHRRSSRCRFTRAATFRACCRRRSRRRLHRSSCPRSSRARSAARAATGETAVQYRSLCVGHERLERDLPRRLLAAVREPPTEGDILVEAGVFAFVARRT